MTTTYKLLKSQAPRMSVGRLARIVAHASDPAAELARYERALLGVARARQHALAGSTSQSLRFALDTLLPARTRGVGRHLKSTVVDRSAFSAFLSHSLQLASDAISEASDAEAIADVVTAALDELHSYVAAHQLVGEGYLAAERAFAEHLAAGGSVPPQTRRDSADTPSSEAEAGQEDEPVSFAAKRDLALAA